MGWLPSMLSASWLVLRIDLNAMQKGKGRANTTFKPVIVFLSMSMGFDLDCCVPFSAPSPKKFTVFRGSGSLCFDFPSVLTMPPLAWLSHFGPVFVMGFFFVCM